MVEIKSSLFDRRRRGLSHRINELESLKMTTFEYSTLADEDFGDAVIATAFLQRWAQDQQTALPIDPAVLRYKFLQVSAFLAEIEAFAFRSVPAHKANTLMLARRPDGDHSHVGRSRVQVSTSVETQWRRRLLDAVTKGELVLLDYASKLPTDLIDYTDTSNSEEPLRKDWEYSARSYAVEICRTEIAKGRDPKQEKVGEEVVVLLRNAEIRTTKDKEISHAYVMKALQPWTAPNEAREMLEKKKIAGK